MNLGPVSTIDEAVQKLLKRRTETERPFLYESPWFVAVINGQGVAHPTMNELLEQSRSEAPECTNLKVATIDLGGHL